MVMEAGGNITVAGLNGLKCQVCGEPASGFHYGVDTCSACKIFFKRNYDRPVKHRCEKGVKVRKPRRKLRKPEVLTCPGCRMRKCSQAGMAMEAIRKGRYTYAVKCEYFLKSQKMQAGDRLDGVGNSVDNRSSSESNDAQGSPPEENLFIIPKREECSELASVSASREETVSTFADVRNANQVPGAVFPPVTSSYDEGLRSQPTVTADPMETIDVAQLQTLSRIPVQSTLRVTQTQTMPLTMTTAKTSRNDVKTSGSDQPTTWHPRQPPGGRPLGFAEPGACLAVAPVPPPPGEPRVPAPMYREPSSALLDVQRLASRLSAMFLSCGTFTPGFFARIRDIEQCYVNHKAVNAQLGPSPLPAEEYRALYERTGVDVDGRQEKLTSRFISLEKRLRSYVAFVKKIHGFAQLPKIDQEMLFKANHTEIGCLSEYRAYNVCLGLRTLPEGIVLDYEDLLSTSHGDYVDLLFNIAERLQKLSLTEDMCNMLKCVALFSPEFCTTPAGRAQTARQQNLMLRALELLLRHTHPRGEDVLAKAGLILADMKLLRDKCAREIRMTSIDFPKLYTPQLVNEVCVEFR